MSSRRTSHKREHSKRSTDSKNRKSKSKKKSKAEDFTSKMEELSYYEILDVSPNADEVTIKKAYRKNAIQWHPDKNQDNKDEAEAMFKLVAEAYEVLSNPEKREVYDRYGKEGLKNGGASRNAYAGDDAFAHFDINRARNLFEQFFGNDPFFNQSFGRMGGGFDDPFFGGGIGGFGGRSMMSRRRDPFDDFFGNSFANFGNMSSQSFSSSGGGVSKSTRTVTQIVNGRRVTKTETTVRYPDGRVETTTDESTDDDVQRIGDNRSGRRSINWF